MTTQSFIETLPSKVNKSAIEGQETNFHFDIAGEGGGQYTVEIKEGEVHVQEGLHGSPKCVISGKGENFIKVITGKLNPTMAVMTGKVKVSNLGEMMKYGKIFGVM
jgi:putative sterol carrier protein